MLIIIGIAIGILLIVSPLVRCFVMNIIPAIYYAILDGRDYIRHRSWGAAPFGQIICYIAENSTSFGCGKTLSATDYIVSLYRRYNDVLVWCPRRQKLVKQRIHIISNVDFLTIPYERLISLQQFVQETNEDLNTYDDENDTLTITYMLIDEASSQLNSRNFKSNFNALFISRLLTSRHVRASIILTSQRSSMVDKLMREVTNFFAAYI